MKLALTFALLTHMVNTRRHMRSYNWQWVRSSATHSKNTSLAEVTGLELYSAARTQDARRATVRHRTNPHRWEVRGWDSAKGDKPCPGCGDGKHWWASCPTFPKSNKNPSLTSAKKIAKAKKAKAAASAASATVDDAETPPAMRANMARHCGYFGRLH